MGSRKSISTMTDITFSIIIPHKPEERVSRLISYLSKIDYPLENIEVILVEGKKPSLQRNTGASLAKGEILFFLDHDCVPFPQLLKELIKGFMNKEEGIAAVGGPCILYPKNSLNLLFIHTLVSFFSHYKMRARYMKLGDTRESNEKELIGSNLCIKKNIFKNLGGFKEVLYPNEENELLNRLKLHNYKVIYNPNAVVSKEIKWSVFEYVKKFFKYGTGRGKELFEESIKLNLIYFVPIFFCFYLISLAFIYNPKYIIFLLVYLIVSLFSGLVYMWKNKKIILCIATPLVFILMHTTYGLGMLYIIFKKLTGLETENKETEIKVKKIKKLGNNNYNNEIKITDTDVE